MVVYAIYNQKHDKIYIGQTEDLDLRLDLHNSKDFIKSYTARFDGVWKLIYQEAVGNRVEALTREKQLKSYRGRQFIKSYIPRYPPAGGRKLPLITMWYVYCLYNYDNDKIYIGYTGDFDRRIIEHNLKKDKSSYTARFDGEWVLIYKEEVSNKSEAAKREKSLKSFRGREYLQSYIPR